MKRISILGATGSIGVQMLNVARDFKNEIEIVGLTADSNIELLYQQIKEFLPKIACVTNEEKSEELKKMVSGLDVKIVTGMEGLIEVATYTECNFVVNSLIGGVGLLPTMKAIESKKDIALANKETLVMAGQLVMEAVRKHGVKLTPIDSEHSAIQQCLLGNKEQFLEKIILTASGGPFRNFTKEQLKDITVEMALKHPNWEMGKKITIDSATLMNKGLEVIEARWLFNVDVENIEVVVHPQSIIHSMVQYKDGSVIAQLGEPDMRLPIQFSILGTDRYANDYKKLNILEHSNLTFERPKVDLFPCLDLAFLAIKKGGTFPAVMNAANEVCVEMFLDKKIAFTDIPVIIEKTMNIHEKEYIADYTLEDILQADKWAREFVYTEYGV